MEGKCEDMATAGEEEVECESDPEEAKLSLTMRRREASDDEEDADEDEKERRENPPRRIDSRGGIDPDRESDSEGAAADYDDDDELEIDEEFEEEEGVVENEEDEVMEDEYRERGAHSDGEADEAAGGARVMDKELDEDSGRSFLESREVEELHPLEEDKKENEPFAVPTAGAFYMHDDRFRGNAVGRHRRTPGGRRLWESKDDRKWGHDKFEEMTLQETHYEDMKERNSRGRYQARGKNQGSDHRYPRQNKSRVYDNSNQYHGPKSVRGRGPRRYEPSANNNIEAPSAQNKHRPVKSIEKASHTSGRLPTATAIAESDPVSVRKQVFASSLNSASPSFYPSGSSNIEIPLDLKRDVQAGAISCKLQPVVVDGSYSISQSTSALRGKNLATSVGMEKIYVDDSISSVAGKPSTSLKTFSSESSLVNNSLQPRAPGRGLAPQGQMTFPPGMPLDQVNRASSPTQLHAVQRSAVQGRVQPALSASRPQLGEGPCGGSQSSSPPKASLLVHSFESGEVEISESNKSKSGLVGKGRGSLQVSGKGPFIYGGAQVIGESGNMGVLGVQNFAATPAFLPVMPFGSQQPGGIGVPAVGMAFPGYVAQPQPGLGNSEMTWLPVLAGAAGALGATYCPPYIAVDGAYHSYQTGQTSSSVAPSKESNTNKSSNEWKPSQRTKIANDEFGQRQKNTRRYTAMNFGQ